MIESIAMQSTNLTPSISMPMALAFCHDSFLFIGDAVAGEISRCEPITIA